VAFEIKFTWSGAALNKGTMTAVSCDGENMPAEPGSRIGEFFVEPSEMQDACLTVNTHQVLQLKRSRFLYMDVGLWLNGHQTLGLVCGQEAALCKYSPSGKKHGSKQANGDTLLDEFLGWVPGLSLSRRMLIPNRYPADTSHLYIILPDMHVPQAPPLSVPPPSGPPPPFVLDEPHHSSPNPDYKIWQEKVKPAYDAYNYACARDLFNSRESVGATASFLDQVSLFPSARQLTLVQLGDMYELWGGRRRYFEEYSLRPGDEDAVRLRGASPQEIAGSAMMVGRWVGGTHLIYSNMFSKFDACEAAGIELRFLHGNHDSYMIRQEVAAEANDFISQYFTSGDAQDTPPDWIRNPVSSKVHLRMHPIIDDGIFIEHGQRVDSSNQDGVLRGHDFTNKAVAHPSLHLKEFDCVRRPSFVTGAAAYWLSHHGDFGLYVMGHTHEPILEYVDVHHQREDMVEVWVPHGDRERKELRPVKSPVHFSQ